MQQSRWFRRAGVAVCVMLLAGHLVQARADGNSAEAEPAAGAGRELPPVDILWVIDDSALMQQSVVTAMEEIPPVLAAAAATLDLRVALTTTNPSPTARTRCRGECVQDCGNAECDGFCDAVVGCLKGCAEDCDSDCTGVGCEEACSPFLGCLQLPDEFDAEVEADGGVSEGLGSGPLFLPGGGGAFYAEDSLVFDCDGDVTGIDDCSGLPAFSHFFPSGLPQRLLDHGGFLPVLESPSCATELLDLTTQATATCTAVGPDCCERLTAVCGDGATVLGSQLCDLLRSMGGASPGGNARRAHSGAELGLRSVRRLTEQMLPALPRDYAATCGPPPCSYEPRLHLRLDCDSGPGCAPCDPRLDPACDVVPLVTVFISDEEDFLFKDDCRPTPTVADTYQLPTDCVWRDGDPTTVDVCDYDYCDGGDLLSFAPDGYMPDRVARSTTSSLTIQWRDSFVFECASTVVDTEVFDCPGTPGCLENSLANIPTMMAASCTADPCEHQPDQASCEAIQIDIGSGPQPYCLWDGGLGRCGLWCDQHTPWGGDIPSQQLSCEADPMCRWDRAKVNQVFGQDAIYACRMRFLVNDCQACKRFLRTREALEGTFDDQFSGTPLIGFADLGPIYALVREEGLEAFGGFVVNQEEDPCERGPLSWGHGDGRAYRDLAAATGGRSGDVCDQTYLPFLQQLALDLQRIASPEIFADGFESGDTSSWIQ